MMDKKIRPWRQNYLVTYRNKSVAQNDRDAILAVLANVARLRNIDCNWVFDYPFWSEEEQASDSNLKEFVSDLVYFRSAGRTKIAAKVFRALIDHVFEDYTMVCSGQRFEVVAQMQKALPLYPFPNK